MFELAAIRRTIALPYQFPIIVCLCGSTRFHEQFRIINLKLTMQGHIILSIGVDTKSDTDLLMAGEITEAHKDMLDSLHKHKIDLADEIFVINEFYDGQPYIGSSTRSEIEYARHQGKPIRWLHPEHAL